MVTLNEADVIAHDDDLATARRLIEARLPEAVGLWSRALADHAEQGITHGWVHDVGAVELGPRHAAALAVVAGAGTAEAMLAASAAEAGTARLEAEEAAAPWIARALGEEAA